MVAPGEARLMERPTEAGATAIREEPLCARTFGSESADITIDFADTRRPDLVTRLLVAGLRRTNGRRFAEAEIWDWTVTRRLQSLLALVAATQGALAEVKIDCPEAGCDQEMEIDLDLAAFPHAADAEPVACSPEENVQLRLRLPTGSDQRRWLENGTAEPSAMAALLIDAGGESVSSVPEHWLSPIADALEAHDPLTALELDVRCPACSAGNRIPFDLEGFLLGQLQSAQAGLLSQVDALARGYHWSEAEIVSIPAWRRAFYLRRLDGGAGR